MESINVFINYGGMWNDLSEYTGNQVAGLVVPFGITYTTLKRKIVERLKLECTLDEVRLRYRVDSNMAPMDVMDDDSVAFYLELKRKDPNLTSFPLCIELVPVLSNDIAVLQTENEIGLSNTCNSGSDITTLLHLQFHDNMTPMQIKSTNKPSLDEVASILCDMAETVNQRKVDADENVITGTKVSIIVRGQIFLDKGVLKKAMKLYAINNKFQFKVKRSDKMEYVLQCLDPSCNWKLKASKVGKTDMFKIRKLVAVHNCGVDAMLGDHRQATSAIVAEVIKNKFTSGKADYKPTDIIHDMLVNYGITLSYEKAWRAREHAFNEIMGDPVDSYASLPAYLRVLRDNNPGTITKIKTDDKDKFKYVFVALGASVLGWSRCKPIIVVDGTYLKGHYGGTLFTACTQDADNGIFVLAFGVGDSENNKSWEWFFRCLREAYGDRDDLCIVSDGCQSIKNAIALVYPDAFHGLCCFHVLGNVTKKYGKPGQNITAPYNAAARAYTVADFNYQMSQLDMINKKIRSYLEDDVKFDKWSRAHMGRNRYNVMTSNIVESVNAVTYVAKKFPIVTLLESLRRKLQEWFNKNRNKAASTFTKLATHAEKELRMNSAIGMKLKVCASSQTIFEAGDGITSDTVNMKEMTCSCNRFQIDKIPCCHALAVIGSMKADPYDYCSLYYSKDYYLETYKHDIYPVGDRASWKLPDDFNPIVVLPPIPIREPGRPKGTRYKSVIEKSQPVRCGRCGSYDHNRRTCKSTQPLMTDTKKKRRRLNLSHSVEE